MMRKIKKIAVVTCCISVLAMNSISVSAANIGYWDFAATPAYTEIPKTITLDYSSNGYEAKTTSKNGGSPTNRVTINSSKFFGSAEVELADITELNRAYDIPRPTYNNNTFTFKVTLRWKSGYTAYNSGYIKRK